MAPGSIKGIVRDVIIVAVAVAVIWIVIQVCSFPIESILLEPFSSPFYVVSSGSMQPYLKVHDIIVITGHKAFEDVKVNSPPMLEDGDGIVLDGDVIVFDRPSDQNKVIVHRVMVEIDDDPRTLRTKGDNNKSSMAGTDYPITEKEYIGTVVHVIPQVGFITKILQPPINYIIIAVIVGIMVVRQIFQNKNKKELAFSDSDEVPPNEKIDELSDDDEYIQSKDFVSVEKTDTEELDKENTKSEENIPEFFQDKEKESEKGKE